MLILASASPRRAQLLAQLGLSFDVRVTRIDERLPQSMSLEAGIRDVARRKAAAAARLDPGAHVLAADTVGVLDGRVLGKPHDDEDARRILQQVSGRTHHVITGIAVASPGGALIDDAVTTQVLFATLSPVQIDAYVALGEGRDKAAGYAIQAAGAAFVREVHGDPSNVVGLPARRTLELLAQAGAPLPPHLRPS